MTRIVGERKRRTRTVAELAAEAGISNATAYMLVKTGQIHSIRAGSKYLIPDASFEAWLSGAGGGPRRDPSDHQPLPAA